MIVTRFAPSPTGYLHIGGVRTALYSWLLAKQQQGRYLLRIEDTDQGRNTADAEQAILDGFHWLGLERDAGPGKEDDKGPYHQMARLPIHREYLQKLMDRDIAYEARESAEELEVMRNTAEAAKQPFIYRRRQYTPEQITQWQSEGRVPVIRVVVPQEDIVFTDGIKGEVRFHGRDIGDFVLMKGDGSPIYYFANMLDDALQGVTQVIRAEEHLSNTPKQIILYNYFWFTPPQFAHLPLIMNPNGKKLSKRDASPDFFVAVRQFQDEGFLPEALLNYLLLVGRNPGTPQEFFTIDEMIQQFSLARVVKSNAVYDFSRALRYNGEYLKRMDDDAFVTKLHTYLQQFGGEEWQAILASTQRAYRLSFAPHIKVRLQTFGQFRTHCQYFFTHIPATQELVCREKMGVTPELIASMLPEIISLLAWLPTWDEDTIKASLMEYITTKWLKNGQVLRPLRALLTGAEASPGAFEMLGVLGQEESLRRLRM
jgi:nondiscriminating glutamyl-tRNA synthetase